MLSHLPFAEDMRAARFAAFDEKPDLMPSAEQREQMARLVKDLDLAGAGAPALSVTEHTDLRLAGMAAADTVDRLSIDATALVLQGCQGLSTPGLDTSSSLFMVRSVEPGSSSELCMVQS